MKHMKGVLKTQHVLRITSNARKLTFAWNLTGFVMVIMTAVITLMKTLCTARRERVLKTASDVLITDVYQRPGKISFSIKFLCKY